MELSKYSFHGQCTDRSRVPYTMVTFVVYENALEQAYKWVDRSTVSSAAITGINLGSGLIAGVAAAVVSQPADTLLSKVNKKKAESGEGALRRLWKIARDTGLRGSYIGIRARLLMVGGMTATQFAIYGDVKKVCSPLAAVPADYVKIINELLTIGSGCNWGDRDQIGG